MDVSKLLFVLLVVTSCVVAERTQYTGYKLVRLTPHNAFQLDMLRLIMAHNAMSEMDFWSAPRKLKTPVEVLLSPDVLKKPTHWFHDIPMDVVSENVQSEIDKIMAEFDGRDKAVALDPNEYNTLEQVEDWMDEQAANCVNTHGHHCSVQVIGQSHEGRPLKVFQIKKDGLSAHRPSYWIDATIHGREWLATATIVKVMDHMLKNYGTDATVTRLVDEYDWYFLPVVNPDGFSFTYHPDGDRLWRKNRRPANDTDCVGTDLNRNFEWEWGAGRVSRKSCGGTYRGPSPASEPETQAIQQKGAEVADHINAWITLHTYGNLVTYPCSPVNDEVGDTCDKEDEEEKILRMAWATADAIMTRHGTTWEWGGKCDVIHNYSGGLDDYVKGALGVDRVFSVTLRGSNFYPPKIEIQPSFDEFWRGLLNMVGTSTKTKNQCS